MLAKAILIFVCFGGVLFGQDSTALLQAAVSDTVRITDVRVHEHGVLRSTVPTRSADAYANDFRALRLLPSVQVVKPSGNSASLRIRNAPAHHTSVVLLGMPLQSSLRGASNFAVLPMQDVVSVHRLDGLSSGSARAIAGAVELDVDHSQDSLALAIGLSAGSYSDFSAHATLQTPLGRGIHVSMSSNVQQFEGDFDYRDPASGETRARTGNDGQKQQVGFRLSTAGIDWFSAYTNITGSSPRSVVSQFGSVEDASLDQQVLLSVAQAKLPILHGILVTSLGAYNEFQAYSDPAAAFGGGAGYQEEYEETRFSSNSEYIVGTSDSDLLAVSVYAAHEQARSKGGSINGTPKRFVGTSQLQWSNSLLSPWLKGASSTLELGISANSHFEALPLAGVSVDVPLAEHASLSVMGKVASRWPSLNELYFLNFGNLNLLPEKSTQVDLSIQTYTNEIALHGTVFYALLVDMISAAPSGAASITALNFHRVRRYGVEVEAAYNSDVIESQFSISYIKSVIATEGSINEGNLTPYSPTVTAAAEFRYTLHPGFVTTLGGTFTGPQFALAGNTPQSSIDHYALVSVEIEKNLRLSEKQKAHLWVSLRNAFDTRYVQVIGYPMPGRSLHVGVRFEYE